MGSTSNQQIQQFRNLRNDELDHNCSSWLTMFIAQSLHFLSMYLVFNVLPEVSCLFKDLFLFGEDVVVRKRHFSFHYYNCFLFNHLLKLCLHFFKLLEWTVFVYSWKFDLCTVIYRYRKELVNIRITLYIGVCTWWVQRIISETKKFILVTHISISLISRM